MGISIGGLTCRDAQNIGIQPVFLRKLDGGGIALVNSDGQLIGAQELCSVNTAPDCLVTATVSVVVGGWYAPEN
jgi:hypothetical protein